jgi:hypothetical protein
LIRDQDNVGMLLGNLVEHGHKDSPEKTKKGGQKEGCSTAKPNFDCCSAQCIRVHSIGFDLEVFVPTSSSWRNLKKKKNYPKDSNFKFLEMGCLRFVI